MAMIEEVLKEDPKVIDAWFTLGNMSARRGKHEQAIGHFKRALALKADDEEAVINMAHAYRKLGRDDDALVGYRRFLELDPKNAQVHYEVAQILIDKRELAEATRELEQALAVEPEDGGGEERARRRGAERGQTRGGGRADPRSAGHET